MKLDLTQFILNREGQEIKTQIKVQKMVEKDGQEFAEFITEQRPSTLGLLVTNALLHNRDGVLKEDEVLKRFSLFNRINNEQGIELLDDEVQYIKERILDVYDVYTAGYMINLINESK